MRTRADGARRGRQHPIARAALALPALAFFIGGLGVRALLRVPPPQARADLAAPLPVVTAWGAAGFWCAAILIACVAAGFAGTLVAARSAVPLRATLAGSALALAAAGTWPVVFSSDVYAYALYGDRAVHGVDPYVPRRLDRSRALERAVAGQWGDPPPRAVYGPLGIASAALAVPFERFGIGAALVVLRLLAAASLVAAAAGLHRARPGPDGRRAAALLALNPAIIWAAVEGHNDLIAIAAVTWTAAFSRMGALRGAAVAAAAAVSTKATAVLPAVVLVWQATGLALSRRSAGGDPALSERSPGAAAVLRTPRRFAFAFAVAAAAAAGYAPLLASLRVAPPLPGATASLSLAGTLAAVVASSVAAPLAAHVTGIAGAALAAIAVVAFAFSRERAGNGGAWSGGALAVWFCAPNIYPWYGAWLAMSAALDRPGPLRTAAVAATICATLRYLADASIPATQPVDSVVGVGTFVLPMLVLVLAKRKVS